MRPNNTDLMTREGNFTGEQHDMSVDERSLAHIMSVLTKMYSDPSLAVIREYSTNARDSHIEAGQTKPIEVSLPNDLSPTFIVRDFGVGLDRHGILNYYAKYGASTKRDTDEQTGYIGIGCKAALSYCAQFTVVGVKDGIKTVVTVGRKENGSGQVTIASEGPTTDPTGVTVKVPVANASDFRQRAEEFFRYWTPGTVLVNGEDPSDIEWLGDVALLSRDRWSGVGDRVVMGEITYPVSTQHTANVRLNAGVQQPMVVRVPMGSVNITPSRESLEYTQRTINSVREAFDKGAKALRSHALGLLDACDTPGEASKVWAEWRYTFRDALTWKGHSIPTFYACDAWVYKPNAARYKVVHRDRLDREEIDKMVLVKGFDLQAVTATHRDKLDAWLDANNLDGPVVLTNDPFGSPWTDDSDWHEWEPIGKRKLSSRKRKATVPTYNWYRDGKWEEGQTVPKPVVFFTPAKYDGSVVGIFAKAFPNHSILPLGMNRWEKFLRDNPTAVNGEAMLFEVADNIDKLTINERLCFHSYKLRTFERLGRLLKKLEDPGVNVEAPKQDVTEAVKLVRLCMELRHLRKRNEGVYISVPIPELDEHPALAKYPLLRYYDGDDDEQFAEYANALYRESK